MAKRKSTNKDLQRIAQKTIAQAAQTPLKTVVMAYKQILLSLAIFPSHGIEMIIDIYTYVYIGTRIPRHVLKF